MRLGLIGGLVSLSVGACSSGVQGTWVGKLECDQVTFQTELTLEHDTKLAYVGTGALDRDYTDPSGRRTNVHIEYDAALEMESKSGAQDLTTTLTCTAEDTVLYLTEGAEPQTVASGCTPRRFADYVVGWDGEEQLSVEGPDGCKGKLTLR